MVKREKTASNLSIKSLLKVTPKKENEIIIEDKKEPFSQEELKIQWRNLVYSFKDKDLDLYSTLSANEPILKEDFIIELSVYNSTQESDINAKKPELLGLLRKKLNNTLLNLDLVIKKSNAKKGFYTEKDKYRKLVEKNPNVDVLRKKFGLSF